MPQLPAVLTVVPGQAGPKQALLQTPAILKHDDGHRAAVSVLALRLHHNPLILQNIFCKFFGSGAGMLAQFGAIYTIESYFDCLFFGVNDPQGISIDNRQNPNLLCQAESRGESHEVR